ncbi:uncharacterized protein GGS22DRAFT_148594 [Annulohypoxylon maeteangense]|uniref:uncharacterized protein n=1 Tax=Annulohypoxylon maeteangense TaxID=1927788 RepID=UPI00200834BD|nr:uncharacterized protein GGS22DRAFT_148594 [Annulohypoxylon maeteangense]KAI0889558.1 hypothetical protein GGS22DRAFT_148594 [Annulohypoxylon maeteangense]
MARGLASTWWHRNHLQCLNYPDLPTKKELIYRIFRAAYPHGAFVDDDLKLAELRDKDTVWQNLETEMYEALKDLQAFVNTIPAEQPRLKGDSEALSILGRYFAALLQEARQALYISQNGRYFEFRSMEELVVRYKRTGGKAWTYEDPDDTGVPTVGGWTFARENLELTQGSEVKYLQLRLKTLDAQR